MKRRDFFKLTMAVASAALLPQVVQQRRLPAFTFDPEQAGRSLMQSYVDGIYPLHGPTFTADRNDEIWVSIDNAQTWELLSDDGGRFIWEASSIAFGINQNDSDSGLHVG